MIAELTAPFCICVDANAHHVNWGSPDNDERGLLIAQWLEDRDLAIINTGCPTYLSATGSFTHIDLTIVSSAIAPKMEWNVFQENFHSDHYPITIDTGVPSAQLRRPKKWITSKANWEIYRSSLSLPEKFTTPTATCTAMEDSMKAAATASIPQTKGNTKIQYSKHYWTPECTQAIRQKKSSFNKYKKHLGDMDLWISHKKEKARYRSTTRKAVKDSWTTFTNTVNPNTPSGVVWNKMTMLSGRPSRPAIVLKEAGELVSNTAHVAELFAKDFSRRGGSKDPQFLHDREAAERSPVTFPQSSE